MELGDVISNRYLVISKIGEGKFGVVYQAHNIKTKQIVAIKTESTGSPIRLLKNETAVLKFLYDQGCRCCPTVYWYGIHLDKTCLAFSFYTMSLYDYLHIVAVDIDKKYKIMTACIEILESIHKYFVIHRDIKPQNFMIKDLGRHPTIILVLIPHTIKPIFYVRTTFIGVKKNLGLFWRTLRIKKSINI